MFVADNCYEIHSCNFCQRIIAVKVDRFSRHSEEILIPGMFAAAIRFTVGIERLGDAAINLTDIFGDVADFFCNFI
jgi:hypothetical protein